MGDQAPRISDFLNELATNPALLDEWKDPAKRAGLLRRFTGPALAALQSGDARQLRDLIRQELGGDATVFIYVR